MPTLFVSDVHLSAKREHTVRAFLAFLAGPASRAQSLYILGDCFDQWLGDDDDTPPHPEVTAALKDLGRAGVRVKVMHGNHDFLLGGGFEEAAGCELLDDYTVIDLYGTRVLLMHGDLLCTDDTDYLNFRAYARDPNNQRAFLSLPFAARVAKASALREKTQELVQLKPADITDVNSDAVLDALRKHGAHTLIHGHTHRPGIHHLAMDGEPATRVVLGDWYEQDSVLRWDAEGYRLGTLAEVAV